jgi:hypothetical protein
MFGTLELIYDDALDARCADALEGCSDDLASRLPSTPGRNGRSDS